MLCRHEDLHVLQAVRFQHMLHRLARAGRDLVDHAPREGQIFPRPLAGIFAHKAVCAPAVQQREKGLAQLFAVVGAVVHGDEGERRAAGLKPPQAAGDKLAEERPARLRAALQIGSDGGQEFAVPAAHSVALLRDGKRNHAETGPAEQLLHARQVSRQREAFRNGPDDLLLHRAVRQQGDGGRKVVKGAQ